MHFYKLIIIGITLFWAGFVSAISFMEAWFKFRVKGVTLPLGLSIGKKVFTALNRVEWTLLILYAALWLSHSPLRFDVTTILSFLLLLILILQTFYLLPVLDKRADLLIEGKSVEKSTTHHYYVFVELIKVVSLFLLSTYNYLE